MYQQVLRFDVSVYDVHSVQVSQCSRQVEQHGAGVSLCVLRGGSDGIKQITALQKTHNTVTHYLHWDCCVCVWLTDLHQLHHQIQFSGRVQLFY